MSELIHLQEIRRPSAAGLVPTRKDTQDTAITSGTFEVLPEIVSQSVETDADSSDNVEYPEGGIRAYSVLLGSFMGLTAHFGLLNSVGAIQTYIATHQLANLSSSTVSWIFSIYLSLAFALTIFVGPYFDAKGVLKPMVLGNILVLCGLMASAQCTKVWQFILSLSICVGIGNALCISPLIGVISHWFYRNIGFAIGLSSIGGSVGGLVIPIMLRTLFGRLGYQWAMRILAFFCFGLTVISTTLIKERFTQDTLNTATAKSTKKKIAIVGKSLFNFQATKDSRFIFLVVGVSLGEISMLSVATFYGTYAIAQGVSENESYVLLTLFNATGILGRLFPGYLSDRIGHFNVMISMLIANFLSIFTLWLPFGSNQVILYVFILLFGFFSSLILSLTPACLRQITPVKEFGARYGLMYFLVSCGNLFGIPVGSAIIGDLSKFHYDMFALFCGVVSLFSSLCWIISRYRIVGMRLNVKI